MTSMTREELRAALPVLELLPEPVLWIGSGYRVRWSNASAKRLYTADSALCYSLFHGLERPCNEMGEPCPKLEAEVTGEATATIHAHLERASRPGLFRVLALPIQDGGVLELHLALGSDLIRDQLTGLFRKEYWLEIAHRGQALLERLQRPYSLIMLDLDRFKDFNDQHGHLAGDELLRAVGKEVRRLMRASDSGCRFGGEELVIFLPNTESDASHRVAERICRAVARLSVRTESGGRGVTASLGTYTASSQEALAESLRRVDSALYRAKAAGRGRVAV